MALAQLISNLTDDSTASDADARIRSAELSDLVFALKRIVAPTVLDRSDLDSLARGFLDASASTANVTKPALIAALRKSGRSPQKADELASAIFK